jgi:hypothetical protein
MIKSAAPPAERRRLVFHHIPKTGGTTLLRFLEQHFDIDAIAPRNIFRQVKESKSEGFTERLWPELEKYSLISGHLYFPIAARLRGKSAVVTIVREPLARLVSQYYHLRRNKDVDIDLALAEKRMEPAHARKLRTARQQTLGEFLRNAADNFPTIMVNSQTKLFMNAFKKAAEGETLLAKKAVANIPRFDCLLILEEFPRSLQLLCHTMGWAYPQSVVPLNRRSDGERPEMTEAERDLARPFITEDQAVYRQSLKYFREQYTQMVATLCESSNVSPAQCLAAKAEPFSDTSFALVTRLLADEFKAQGAAYFKQRPHLLLTGDKTLLHVGMAQALSGESWLEREGASERRLGRICRWSGPLKQSTLNVWVQSSTALIFRMKVLEALSPEALSGLRIEVAGNVLPLKKTISHDGATIVSATLPAASVPNDGLLQLSLNVPQTLSHRQARGEPDDRQKGLRLAWFEFEREEGAGTEVAQIARRTAATSDLIHLLTPQHTGTHFCRILMETHPDISACVYAAMLKENDQAFKIAERYFQGQAGLGEWADFARSQLTAREQELDIRVRADFGDLNVRVAEKTHPAYLLYHSHINRRLMKGASAESSRFTHHKTVVTLRDPLLAIISALRRTNNGVQSAQIIVQAIQFASAMPNAFFFCTDLWRRDSEKALSLFDYLGLKPVAEARLLLAASPTVNGTDWSRYPMWDRLVTGLRHWLNKGHVPAAQAADDIPERSLRQRAMEGRIVRKDIPSLAPSYLRELRAAREAIIAGAGIHPVLNEWVALLRADPRLEQFYRELGYRDLAWFRPTAPKNRVGL